MQLTQKETDFINDFKNQEKLCIDKYTKYSSQAKDPQLKNLFSQISGIEQQHLNTLDKICSGSVPQLQGGASAMPTFTAAYNTTQTQDKSDDCFLCSDLLAGEKHVSHLYDTGIFEFRDENVRNVLNHIQKEEQNHGKMIYDYMAVNSMYS